MADGDSITAGTATTSYPQVAVNALTPGAIRVDDVGQSGHSCAQQDSGYATNVAPHYDATETRNVATLLCGANDWQNNTTDLSSYTSILSWAAKAKATGFSVIIITNPSRSVSSFGGPNSNGQTGDQYVQALATRIRNGAVANGYTVADVNGDATIGCTGCYTNSTYFQGDGIHLLQAGYNIIGGTYLKAALQSLGFY